MGAVLGVDTVLGADTTAADVMLADEDPLVPSPWNLLEVLRTMGPHDHTLTMWNRSREFKVRMRLDVDEKDSYDIDMGLIHSPPLDEDTLVERALAMERDQYLDDDLFVVEEHSIPKNPPPDETHPTLVEAWKSLVGMLDWELCGCGEGFIKTQGHVGCLVCMLTTPRNSTPVMCGVCHSTSLKPQTSKMGCCGQTIHKKCMWKCTRCPFCRADM